MDFCFFFSVFVHVRDSCVLNVFSLDSLLDYYDWIVSMQFL